MKVKKLRVSFELMKKVLAQDNKLPPFRVIKDGIPSDAVPTYVSVSSTGTLWIYIQSNGFPEVEEGQQIPELKPLFEVDS